MLYLSNSVITDNLRGVSITATGTVHAFGNNRIAGNGTDIAETITPAGAQ